MSPEILSGLLQGLGAILGALLIFYLGRLYEKRDKGNRQIIETGVTVSELVNPNTLGPISMSVDKSFVTGQSSAKGKLPVKSAYNYVVGVSNVGLDDINNPEIDIILDDKAIVIEVKVKSDNISQDKISIQGDAKRPYFRRVIPQYINKNDSFEISVVNINNTIPNYEVMVGGIGISHQTRSSSAELGSTDSQAAGPVLKLAVSLAFFVIGAILLLLLLRPVP